MTFSMIVRCLALLIFVCGASFAQADPLDDTLAKFQEDKFPQTAAAISELAVSGAPNAAAILDALGDNRLFVDPAAHLLVYKNLAGDFINARTNEKLASAPASLKKVRVNNGLRAAIEAAIGSLTLANADPAKRIEAADAVFKSRDAKALPALEAALAKRLTRRPRPHCCKPARRFCVGDNSAAVADRLAAVEALKTRADQDAELLLGEAIDTTNSRRGEGRRPIGARLRQDEPAIVGGGAKRLVRRLRFIGVAARRHRPCDHLRRHGRHQHGAWRDGDDRRLHHLRRAEPVCRRWAQQWSLAISLPLAFLVSGAVGVLIERLVIRYLYGRPLETLLATWGVSLILQQAVRTIFGANNRLVTAPAFMSGSFHLGGL